ncbi:MULTISPECIES: hypothetical protein [unclassified Oleiphilus]|uniref:hypothetical protein n=1 Tax=unclassified Oleiphilus TaxID=2631174 RepID=UPI0007C2D205|nr:MULTISPECIES: hypothetical protein [unclassified Oleiphilus]KZY43775.1 hypothetical protein A3732_13640 [Oleiphilus sp. HI0050]KZZ38009.1 hypothetical protein A3757_09105 [Oleiphilus sp. HI0117]KZZ56180.1 hypothetical protein A3761_09690 [Oleiphilus sp. HI0123]
MNSKPWFWKIQSWLRSIGFILERNAYKTRIATNKAKYNFNILSSFTWLGMKSLFWVVLCLAILILAEDHLENDLSLLSPFSLEEMKFNIDQLRLYAQLLTAIFSIYFATIGIILSTGYTKLRRDIIQMLTNEQVGSIYSRVLVLAAVFCLVATALPLLGVEPGILIYLTGTVLTLLSALALFPLGQRLFNFFDLNQLVRSEILPNIADDIKGAANRRNSVSLSNYHSKAAQRALNQLFYIDDRVKADKEGLDDNLPQLSEDYSALLLHYIQQKHTIDQDSYWFPRLQKHKQWFLAGDSATSMALRTCSQEMLVEMKPDHQWLENEIINKLAGHVELAFQDGDLNLALNLISKFSSRIPAYSERFQFDIGIKEIKKFKEIIEHAFEYPDITADSNNSRIIIGIADTWVTLGSNLCIETLRRMITFEKDLKRFFEVDEWNEKAMQRLPSFLQLELDIIAKRIEFEKKIEGKRLSKPKYVQQLAVQRLLQHYSILLPEICDFFKDIIPSFVESLVKIKMSEAATQVVLSSLHSYWKLPRWFDEISRLIERYQGYEHYNEKPYIFPDIDVATLTKQLASSRDEAITKLGSGSIVHHIFEPRHDEQLPDHFGQIYFELAEACISALEQNDESKLDKVLPMFLSLGFLAENSKFKDPSLDVNDEFRLHLFSTVINDMASVLGFAILYGAYFDNKKLSTNALSKFDSWIKSIKDKEQYLKRMLLLSNTRSFSMSASPRDLIRINWKMSFERRAREDGFLSQGDTRRGNQHPDKIVNEFLDPLSEASHLFFAKQVLPQLKPIDFDVDHQITGLARRLREEDEEVKHENH